MARKRMMSNAILDTDKFRALRPTAQGLYLVMLADVDDDGFVSAKKPIKMNGFHVDDLKSLQENAFIHVFESGVCVILHHHIHNWLDSRRVKPTIFQAEFHQLKLTKQKSYLLSNGLANAKQMHVRIDESRIDESSTNTNTTLKMEVKNSEPEILNTEPEIQNIETDDERREKLFEQARLLNHHEPKIEPDAPIPAL